KIVATAPRDSHSPIVYPIAIAQDSKHPEAAQYFIQFILSNAAGRGFRSVWHGSPSPTPTAPIPSR
ncbi:MAG: extracellular solute-binding protein, partial [Moorea sp. SIO2B7]|nr:extracellular solute-binding protein [Moorena sp. SIO2B7]